MTVPPRSSGQARAEAARQRFRRGWLREDRGSATAETAIVLPAVVLMVLVLLVAGLGLTAQVRLESGARAAARELARGEDPATAVAVAERVAGDGVQVSITQDGEWVSVRVDTSITAPTGLLAGATWHLTADAQARREPHLVGAS